MLRWWRVADWKLGPSRAASSVVYIARQHALGDHSRVALKLIQRADLDDVALRRFERERASLAKLSRAVSGVVTVFDAGVTANGWPWISMELMQGGSARRLDPHQRPHGPHHRPQRRCHGRRSSRNRARTRHPAPRHEPENVLLNNSGQPKTRGTSDRMVADMGATRSRLRRHSAASPAPSRTLRQELPQRRRPRRNPTSTRSVRRCSQ